MIFPCSYIILTTLGYLGRLGYVRFSLVFRFLASANASSFIVRRASILYFVPRGPTRFSVRAHVG